MTKSSKVFCTVTLLFLPTFSYAVDKPYCGLHCLYSAMKIQGSDIEFKHLLDPNYISYPEGSSLRELKQAVEDHELIATPFKNFLLINLKNIHEPTIIHVRMDFEQKKYNHFVLYLGKKDGKALILDPPGPVKLMGFSELAALWDGTGLIVSKELINLSSILMPARIRLGIYIGIVLVCIGVYHLFFRFLKRTAFFKSIIQDKFWFKTGVSGVQAVGVLSIVFVVSVMYHFLMPGGLLSLEGEVVEGIQNAYAGSFIPKIGERKVHKLLDSNTVFIDARYDRDFKAGHLKGAISVPVDANDVELQKATADIPKDSRIVMYCQSSRCKYAEIVAIKLQNDGYSIISIFKGGWAEWVAKNGKKEDSAS